MKKIILLFLCTICYSSFAFSQGSNSLADKIAANTPTLPYTSDDPKCTTMEAIEYRIATDPQYAQFYNTSRAIPQAADQARIPCDGTNSIVVPVAFHFAPGVVTCGDTDCLLAEVQDQLDAMNAAFGDNTAASATMVGACPAAYGNGADVSTGTCISFCLAIPPAGGAAGLDPACDPPITVGVFTGGFGAGGNGAPGWDGILNMFITPDNTCLGVADGIPGAGNGDGVSTCASAFGGTAGSAGCGLDTDGTYNLGATMIHEIGHYLGLYHTFQGGCGDEPGGPGPFSVTDTPPASNPYFGCNMATCEASGCGGGVQGVANFMDYTDDACMTMFTEDQAQVMNYWANQLFGGTANQCSAPSPTELTTLCAMQPCVLVCPASVITPYSGTDEICAISTPSYDLPTDFSSVVLDDASDAVYTWSTGGYLSAGGVAVAGPYAVSPAGCEPLVETFYLNVDCGTTPLTTTLDAGTLVLTAYPDPSTFIATDLATFTDGDCGVPTWVITPGCEAFVTITPLDEPAAVNPGDMGTVNYDITLAYPVACCCPATMATLTESNTTPVTIPDGAGAGNPGCSTVTIPAGGSIEDVTLDVGITHTWVGDLTITLTSPAGTTVTLGDQPGVPASGFGCDGNDIAVTFDDAATNTSGDFENACGNLPAISGSYQPIDALSAFDGEDAAGVWTLCASDAVNADAGMIDNFTLNVDIFEPCMDPAGCTIAGMANYTCTATGVPYCDNICFAEYNAAPGPDDTPDATLCMTPVGCGGDASCLVTQACDDMDPCTINDMETVAPDGSVCVPCAGTVDMTSCDAACTTTQPCDDGDPCTMDEMETLAADGSVCVPCGGGMAVTPACGDPTATNYDATATCIDNTLCTYGEYCDDICFAEYTATPGPNDTPNATLCVTPVSCTGDASCFTTQACDDGDPCTTGEMETLAPDGSVCVPCGGGTAVAAACGDPTATNYDATATCIDNTLCTYAPCEDGIAGMVTLDGCDFTGAMVTIYDDAGTVVGTAMTDATGSYSLAGPFACGTYTAELTAAPPCYVDEGGELGPAAFTINGDGIADGYNFAPIPENIPTVGEWGLIILGLMMSIVAIIGIRERKSVEMYS